MTKKRTLTEVKFSKETLAELVKLIEETEPTRNNALRERLFQQLYPKRGDKIIDVKMFMPSKDSTDRNLDAVIRQIEDLSPPLPPQLLVSPTVIELAEAKRFSELIGMLSADPTSFRDLTSRQFEELTAELFLRMGHDVALTPEQRDGGYDIAVRIRDGFVRHLVLVECKQYLEKPVGVGVVRSLLGVVTDKKASSGLLVTTSRFTRGARTFQADNQYRLELADMPRLQDWLRDGRE